MRAPGEQPKQDKVSSDLTFFFKIPSSPEHLVGTLPQTFYLPEDTETHIRKETRADITAGDHTTFVPA